MSQLISSSRGKFSVVFFYYYFFISERYTQYIEANIILLEDCRIFHEQKTEYFINGMVFIIIEGQVNSAEWRPYIQEAILEKMCRKIDNSWVRQQAMNDVQKNLTSSFLDMRGQDRTWLQCGPRF